MQGTVQWFNNAKGYGFIKRAGGEDVFVHYSSIISDGYKSLTDGDTVEFEVVNGPKGEQADQVQVLTRARKGDRETNEKKAANSRH